MKRIALGLAAVVALAIMVGAWQGWIAQASPDEVYVNDNVLPDVEGCNSPDANTIADGILAADTGDTVILCEGTYDGDVDVDKGITLEGRAEAVRADIVVKGAGFGLGATADDVTIRHMRLDGVDAAGFSAGISVDADNATIEDVEAVNWASGIMVIGSSGSTVSGSEVDDNTLGGIVAADGDNNVISGNVVGDGNPVGVSIQSEDLTVVMENELSGSDTALQLLASAPAILNVRVVRNTINAASDGILIEVIDAADSLIVIGGRPENANTFAGSPDSSAGDYFVDMKCGTGDTEVTVAAMWNYWAGLTDRAAIADVIHGDEDDDECAPHGAVVFHPWATEPAPTATPSPTPSPTATATPTATPSPTAIPPTGTRDFDLEVGWNDFVWTGASATDPETALGCIVGDYVIAYRLVETTQGYERFVPDDALLSNMGDLEEYDSLLVLVTAATQCEDMPVAP